MKRKTSVLLAALAMIALVFYNCTNTTGKSGKTELTVEEVMANTDSLAGQTITVEGVCTHVCAKTGMKLFLQGADGDQSIRVESNSTIGKFDTLAIDQNVRVVGKLVEDRITEADVQQMEQDIENAMAVSHGEGGEGCATEQESEGVAVGSSEMERVNDFRARIAERKAKEGKDYLSLYHIAADNYRIIK